MTATRQTLAGLSRWEVEFWYGLVAISTATFCWGAARLVAKYRRGRRLGRSEGMRSGAARMAGIVLSHRWIRRRDPVAGIAHALVFYGFMLLFAGTVVLGIEDDFTKPVFRFSFWHGTFYRVYSLILDVSGTALLVGLALMAVKRGVQRPRRLDYARPDREEDRQLYVIGDWAFLGALFFLALTGFLLESFRLAELRPSFETWSPVGWVGGGILRRLGTGPTAASSAHFALWWVHGVAALTFVASIPFTKAVHMLVAPANVAVRERFAGKKLPLLPANAKADEVGYSRITDLSWQHLASLDACTKCGKCHVACPATSGGYPLSPRDLILDLREMAEGALGVRSARGLPPGYAESDPIVGTHIRAETVWSCTQCMACVEICPVGIEHVPIINQLRRGLVERGEMDPLLQSTLESVYENGNSFGEPKRKRARWARELEFEVKDARKEPVELLWFVGDYASYDTRNQRNTRALAQLLQLAEVDFGILFEGEKTAGCDVRRVGEESLWASLAAENIKLISKCRFERIVSSDPHTFHTLRNEYPQHGVSWNVVHHTQLLLELLNGGPIAPQRRLGYRVTYHDPCALGRYNGVYEEPRELLRLIGCELVEMPRNRDNSLCCGAGGGRIWMKELSGEGARRPSEQRIDEAVALGDLDYFVVACPKDVTMYEDAIKTSGHEGKLQLRELSELVLEATLPAHAISETQDASAAAS